jgi:site-specific recombinase XerD
MTDAVAPVSTPTAVDDIRSLLPDWRRHLLARNKAPRTITTYLISGERLAAFLAERGMPTAVGAITREHVETFVGHLVETCAAPTAARHYRSLQQLFRWLLDEGEIPRSPMERMRPPAVPEQPVPLVGDDEIRALLAACKGNTFENRRDTAIVLLLLDTGVRVSELVGMGVDDADRDTRRATVLGKGRRARSVSFGARTNEALSRYLRLRARQPGAGTTAALWLGKKGAMTDSGVRQMLERRAIDAGLTDPAGKSLIHPHLFRHMFAHRWLAGGGQEGDLMALAGWRSRQMVGRYASSAAAERAHEAHQRLALGDKL